MGRSDAKGGGGQDRGTAQSRWNHEPKNLEEQAISLVGTDIYEKLVKGYTEKQWGRPCSQLPAFIIKRLPVRFTFDNNYFNALYQGIPIGGYTKMVANMLYGIEVRLGIDYLENKKRTGPTGRTVIYTGPIDAYFEFRLGTLEYNSEWKPGDEPYYPVNDEKNGRLYEAYQNMTKQESKVIFGGRLGEYKYYDMDQVIEAALKMCGEIY